MIKEKLQEKYKDLFSNAIIFRGRDYYNNSLVKKLYKSGNSYIAKVESNTSDNEYDVQVILDKDDIKLSCTCPCVEHCKHEYAALMAIDDQKYMPINLLPVPDTEELDLSKLISAIPAKELKKYIYKIFDDEDDLNKDDFVDYFSCYLPQKSRDYFYNTLYNSFQLSNEYRHITNFIEFAKRNLEIKNYDYAFDVISAIIDAAKEYGYKDEKEILLNLYNKLGMFIRIAYRKGNKKLKEKIDKWVEKIKLNDCYNDIYLEDMILSLSNT